MYKLGTTLFVVGILSLLALGDIFIYVQHGLPATLCAMSVECIIAGIILISCDE